MAIFGPVLQKPLDRNLFPRAKLISRHFRISPPAVKEILGRKWGLKKFTRRLFSHLLSDQKKLPIDASRKLLSLLGIYAEHNFEGMATGNESWF
jgi:hypothetical protein